MTDDSLYGNSNDLRVVPDVRIRWPPIALCELTGDTRARQSQMSGQFTRLLSEPVFPTGDVGLEERRQVDAKKGMLLGDADSKPSVREARDLYLACPVDASRITFSSQNRHPPPHWRISTGRARR